MTDNINLTNKYWTRKRVNFGFGIQTFGLSNFGSSISHGTRLGFGEFSFGKIRFGSAGPDRGPTSSYGRIDNYQGYEGRLNNKCISASGELAAEEIYWQKHIDKRSACIPKPTKVASHYLTLRRAKINGLTAYIYYRWKKLSDNEKAKYKKLSIGKKMSCINIYLKKCFDNWGFGKSGFGSIKFGSCHQPPIFFGFSLLPLVWVLLEHHIQNHEDWGLGRNPLVKSDLVVTCGKIGS